MGYLFRLFLALALGGLALAAFGTAARARDGSTQLGLASWYHAPSARKRTASGDRFDDNALTAAHRSLPQGTLVRVTNLDNGHAVVVRINDRGPHYRGRIIDVSPAAARELGMKKKGLARVRVEVLKGEQAGP